MTSVAEDEVGVLLDIAKDAAGGWSNQEKEPLLPFCIEPGFEGPAVLILQVAIIAHGGEHGVVLNSQYDAATRRWVKQFQQAAHHGNPTGNLDRLTLHAIFLYFKMDWSSLTKGRLMGPTAIPESEYSKDAYGG